MTLQYNLSIKVLDPKVEWRIQQNLKGYKVFTDEYGNLKDTCFGKEDVPYVGEIVVMKTLRKEAAETAHELLKGIEGLVALPITECDWEEDKKRCDERLIHTSQI